MITDRTETTTSLRLSDGVRSLPNNLRKTVRLGLALILIAASAFGVAWFGVLAVKDFNFMLGTPDVAKQFLGTAVALVSPYVLAWWFRKYLLLAFLIMLIPAAGGLWWLVDTGRLSKPLPLFQEVATNASQIRKAIEKAHADGKPHSNLYELQIGGFMTDNQFDERYYSREAYSWEVSFDSKGKFNGIMHVRGDTSRNVPEWTMEKSAWSDSGMRYDLPVFELPEPSSTKKAP